MRPQIIPSNAVNDLGVTHHQLGTVYSSANELDQALYHFREAIRYEEAANNVHSASETRFNVALMLARAGRFEDALDYAHAVLRGFESYGDRAAENIQQAQKLIAQIDDDMKKAQG